MKDETEKKIEEFSEAMMGVLADKPPHDLITFFQAMLLAHKGNPFPSEDDMIRSRAIAYGMSLGFKAARKSQTITEDELIAVVKESVETAAMIAKSLDTTPGNA